MSRRTERLIAGAFAALVFLFCYFFFTQMHPLVIYDTDDWCYLAFERSLFPEWGAWNPTRILPEVLLPLMASLASGCVMPLGYDLVDALTLVYGFVLSCGIAFYTFAFHNLVQKRFSAGCGASTFLALLFLLAHFLIYRAASSGNQHLFLSINANCAFFYTLPVLLNGGCVMLLAARTDNSLRAHLSRPLAAAGYLVLIYFSVFSNLFSSVVLAVYAALALPKNILRKKGADGYAVYALILALWIVSLAFEYFGGRSNSLIGSESAFRFSETAGQLARVLARTNRPMLLILPALILAGIAVSIRKKRMEPALFLAASVLTAAFLFLLCARAFPWKFSESQIQFSAAFFLLLAAGSFLALVVSAAPKLMVVLPLAAILMLAGIQTESVTFYEPNVSRIPADRARTVTRSIIDAVVQADEQGASIAIVRVPDYDAEDNWPLALYAESWISRALEKHGIVDGWIEVYLVPDPGLNEEWGLPGGTYTN